MRKAIVVPTIIIFLLLAGSYFYFKNRNPYSENYLPPEQRKTVEAYFIEHMRVSPAEAQEMAANGVDLRVSKDTTLRGIVGNLYYYGFIDSEAKLNKLLETTKDTTPGQENSIKVGNNTIDVNSHYYLNYEMTDEEIADTLLNKAKFASDFTAYNYLFMPSGRGGPSQRPDK
jgi:hypothetical protein